MRAMTEDDARTALEARLEELDRLDAMSASGREPVTLQQDAVGRLSRMDAMQQQAMAQAEERRRQSERSRIRRALAAIEEGEWGWCATCGEQIAEGRLRNDPSLATCVACAGGGS